MKLRYILSGTKDPIAVYGGMFLVILLLIMVVTRRFVSWPSDVIVATTCIVFAVGLMSRMIYLQFRPVEDELELAVLRYGFSVGFWIGSAISICLLMAVMFIPNAFESLFQLSVPSIESDGLGKHKFVEIFAFGWMAAMVPIMLSMVIVSYVRGKWIDAG